MSALHKVLVVDDDPVVGKSFSRVLSNKGYAVITAQNAQEALTKLQEAKYDLVYTDIRMPGMDGLELAEQVKAKHPWTPVVIVTGYGTTANEARARAAGVSAFLHKPLSPEMIEGSAANALVEPAPMVVAQPEAKALEAARPAVVAAEESNLKKVALLIAGPFIGLAYVILFPFIGMGMLATLAIKALAKKLVAGKSVAQKLVAGNSAAGKVLRFVKNVTLFIAAPFIGLAYVVMLPFVGLGMLAWSGIKALVNKSSAE